MKFLFDQNISHRILKNLPESFSSSVSVKKLGLIDASDKEIWEYAKKHDFIIVTQDADFKDMLPLYGFPPKIIWIRTGNVSTHFLAGTLINYLDAISAFYTNDEVGCFEIIQFSK